MEHISFGYSYRFIEDVPKCYCCIRHVRCSHRGQGLQEQDYHPFRLEYLSAVKIGGQIMEPLMCPFCGGTNLFQEDDFSLELDIEYWTVHHWECLECGQSFDKIDILPVTNTFEEMNENTIH
jgi:hypothetical protein